jgi:hypothetical protein
MAMNEIPDRACGFVKNTCSVSKKIKLIKEGIKSSPNEMEVISEEV